jgi:hypothetical protein
VCQGTSPEGGRFEASSCRSRTANFVFDGAPPIDATQTACLDVCPGDVEQVTIAGAPPWLEAATLADGLALDTALACALPQGVDGCGFEQPLESMYKALLRAQTDGEDEFGFLRPQAHLLVVLVSDETDCSANADYAIDVFLPEGSRVFWSDDDAGLPTSAACWNAGVSCSGGPGTYDACMPAAYDASGQPTNDPDLAVLHPLARYVAHLQDIADEKASFGAGVFIGGLLGTDLDGSVVYRDAEDPAYQLDFGIGPGCTSRSGAAVPPVRELVVAAAFPAPTGFASICAPEDFGARLVELVDAILP